MYAITPQTRAPRPAPARSDEPAAKVADGDVADADSTQIDSDAQRLQSLMEAIAEQRAVSEQDEILLQRQREQFDLMMQQRAEAERERNALAALAMEQRKHDDEILKAWIRLI